MSEIEELQYHGWSGIGFARGLISGSVILVGQFIDLPAAIWIGTSVVLVAGLVTFVGGAIAASRSSGEHWARSLWMGVRSAVRFVIDFL